MTFTRNDDNWKCPPRQYSSSENLMRQAIGMMEMCDSPSTVIDRCTTRLSAKDTNNYHNFVSNFKNVLSLSNHGKRKQRRKRVRFAGGDRSSPVTQVVKAPSCDLSDEEMKAYWWTRSDMEKSRRYSKTVALRACQSDFWNEFDSLYQQCAAVSCDDDSELPMENFAFLSERSTRGLETSIYWPLTQNRRAAIKTLLSVQEQLPLNMRAEERCSVLSVSARIVSRHACQLARVIGNADATAVATFCATPTPSSTDETMTSPTETNDACFCI